MTKNTSYQSDIAWIDVHPAFRGIEAKISDEQPAGFPIDDHPLFEEIDAEMMKRGTLSHGSIRWDFVMEQSILLLEKEAKDLRLVTFVLHCLPQMSDITHPLPFATHLVACFLHNWGKNFYPTARAGGRQLARLVDILDGLIAQATQDGIDDIYQTGIMQALMLAGEAMAEYAPDLGIRMSALAARVEKIELPAATSSAPSQPQTSHPAPSAQNRGNASAGSSEPQAQPAPLEPEKLILDSSNERGLKQSLSYVADFLLDFDVTHPLSYRLRRYASWFDILAAPPIKTGEKTVIPALSQDAADNCRLTVERKATDADSVKRLERICHLHPFWIEGNHIAWRLAHVHGREEVLAAIGEETVKFVTASPWLHELCFADGTPFLTDETKAWLGMLQHKSTDSTAPSASSHAIENHVLELVEEARALATGGDMAAALKLLETTHATFSSPRAQTIWEILTLECLHDWGMRAHSATQAARLEATIKDLPVAEWDAEILTRLQKLKSNRP